MKSEKYLYERYNDLLAEETGDERDEGLLRVVGALHLLSEENQPPVHVLTSLEGKLHSQGQVHAHVQAGPRSRLQQIRLPGAEWTLRQVRGWGIMTRMAGGLLALVLVIAATYSLMSVMDRAFYMDESTARIAEQKLGVEVNQSVSANGFTMNVRRVYADSDRVVVGYTISGPPGRIFNSFLAWGDFDDGQGNHGTLPSNEGNQSQPVATLPTLTDTYGNSLSIIGNVLGTDVYEGEYGQALAYKMVRSVGDEIGTAKEITLHFEAKKITAIEQLSGGKLRDVIVVGPFAFDFTVPISPSTISP